MIEKTRWGYFVSSEEAVVIAYRQQYLMDIGKGYLRAKEKGTNEGKRTAWMHAVRPVLFGEL